MVIEIAIVVVKRLAVVAGEDHDGVLFQAQRREFFQDLLDAGVHIGDRRVVLRDHVIRIRASLGHPGADVIAEGLEIIDLLHALVVGIERVALEEDVLERLGREVRGVRIHVPHEEEERLILLGQAFQLGDGHIVEVLRLVRAAVVVIRAPARKAEVLIVAAAAGVAFKTDAGAGVALFAQDFRQHGHAIDDVLLAQRHDVRAEAIAAGHHVRVTGRGGDVRRKALFKRHAAFGVFGDVRRGQPGIAIVAHVIPAQAIDAENSRLGSFLLMFILLYRVF